MVGFDTAELFGNLYGAKAVVPEPITRPEAADPPADPQVAPPDTAADPLAALPFADWVQRPDWQGRMGWEAPGLPESNRWWSRCDFDDLPEVPVGFSIGELPKQAPRIAPGCDSGGISDNPDLGGNRFPQGRIEGFCGARK